MSDLRMLSLGFVASSHSRTIHAFTARRRKMRRLCRRMVFD